MPASRVTLLRKRLDRFARVLGGVEQGDVRALHRARVASRRLRELIPVLEVDQDVARKLGRRLRKITNRLGIVRELDVLLLLIDELHVSRRPHREALGRVAVAVAKSRDDARARLVERAPVGEMRRIARKLGRVADRLETGEREADAVGARAWRWAVEARVARRASALSKAMQEAGAVYLAERLHAVRIALKKLRYAAELAAAASGESGPPELRTLKRAQEILGHLHDRQVLLDRVRQEQASLTPPSVSVWRSLEALTTDLERECRLLHAQYMRIRPELESVTTRLARRSSDNAARRPRQLAG